MICERCSREVFKHDVCDSCNRKICSNCIKASRRLSVTKRLVICKDCWSKMKSRKVYKSAKADTGREEKPTEERDFRGRR